ncbi:hypothetical protein [Ruegeria sp. HKCCD7255]|uniref:hypothetical protein n=1 Tax=Ruegeria sp. HKCCD7255 TaxID=2683004 RepID=UPI001488F83B|nr:hypothetical protein [Ruegeria sp. HKCCD7255]
MLWLHIGMPKTGTTALQGFIRGNEKALSQGGLRYMHAGRKRESDRRPKISHNMIAFDLNGSGEAVAEIKEAMAGEYTQYREGTCLVSSEMFYSVDMTELARIFADIPKDEMRVTFYCRRYSDFFEADYKQRAKNGRLAPGGTAYIRQRLKAIADAPQTYTFTGAAHRVRTAFPDVEVVPMLYDRAEMVNGNVIDDFLTRISVPIPDTLSTDSPSNPSLSRPASEAFGIVSRAMGRQKSRQLRRSVLEDPTLYRRHDVLESSEREWLDGYLAEHDAEFQTEFFPERATLFAPTELDEAATQFRRDTPEETEALRRASEIVFRLALTG